MKCELGTLRLSSINSKFLSVFFYQFTCKQIVHTSCVSSITRYFSTRLNMSFANDSLIIVTKVQSQK
jgi:hypothetical protein